MENGSELSLSGSNNEVNEEWQQQVLFYLGELDSYAEQSLEMRSQEDYSISDGMEVFSCGIALGFMVAMVLSFGAFIVECGINIFRRGGFGK